MTPRRHLLKLVLLLLPAIGYVTVFLAAALTMTVMLSFGFFDVAGESEVGLGSWASVVDEQTLDSMWYSIRIALASAFGALVLAFPLAVYLRGRVPGKGLFNVIVRVPLFVPALVAAFLIMNVLSHHGILNEVLVRIGLVDEPLTLTHDSWGLGVVVIQIWKNLPLQLLILTAVLSSVPPELEEAVRNLGGGWFRVFRHVLLPQSAPGIQIGATLVFIGVLGDYAINAVAGPLYPPSLSIRMYLLGKTFGEWGEAAVIALMIVILSIIFAFLFTLFSKLLVRVAR